jgi:hypothetical protein
MKTLVKLRLWLAAHKVLSTMLSLAVLVLVVGLAWYFWPTRTQNLPGTGGTVVQRKQVVEEPTAPAPRKVRKIVPLDNLDPGEEEVLIPQRWSVTHESGVITAPQQPAK